MIASVPDLCILLTSYGENCVSIFSVVFLHDNYSNYFDDFTFWLSCERSFPFGLLVFKWVGKPKHASR